MQGGESLSQRRRRYFGYLLAAGVSIVVLRLVIVPALHAENFGIEFFPDGKIEIRDFPSILVFAKAFWKGTATYDVQSYISATSEWAGRPLDIALPFPYSPTMLWLLAPFCALPVAWAFTVWTILGLCVVWRLTGPRWPLWVGVACFSPTAMICFNLGQTVLLTTAALLFLYSLGDARVGRSTVRSSSPYQGGASSQLKSPRTPFDGLKASGKLPANAGWGSAHAEPVEASGGVFQPTAGGGSQMLCEQPPPGSLLRKEAVHMWRIWLGAAILWALSAKPQDRKS